MKLPPVGPGGYAPGVPAFLPHQRSNRIRTGLGLALLALLPAALPLGVRAVEAGTPDGGAVLMDEIVAVVGTSGTEDYAILWSDLFLEARLLSAKREGSATFLETPTPGDLSVALEHLIDERVVQEEAKRLQVFVVGTTEIDRAIQELRRTVGPKAFDQFLTEKQIDDATIREIVERGLRADRYLEGRFKGPATPKESEVDGWIATHPDEFAGLTPKKAREAVTERLIGERLPKLKNEFTADVRRRARVRILHDPAMPSAVLRLSGSSADAGQG